MHVFQILYFFSPTVLPNLGFSNKIKQLQNNIIYLFTNILPQEVNSWLYHIYFWDVSMERMWRLILKRYYELWDLHRRWITLSHKQILRNWFPAFQLNIKDFSNCIVRLCRCRWTFHKQWCWRRRSKQWGCFFSKFYFRKIIKERNTLYFKAKDHL